jgi:Xaa-Pro aminopeptidase
MNEICHQKLEQAQTYMNEYNIDMWLFYVSEGSDSAVKLLFGIKTVGRTIFLLFRDGRRISLCSLIDAQESRESGLFSEVLSYQNDFAEKLRGLIRQYNPAVIAINYSLEDNLCDGLTTGRYRWLCGELGPDFEKKCVSSEKMLQRIRSIKSSKEIEAVQEAVKTTEEIFREVLPQIRTGMTEYEAGCLFLEAMKSRNVVEAVSRTLAMPIIMKEHIAHRAPGSAVIRPGDYLIIDFGVLKNGYCSDIARTLYFLRSGESDAPPVFEEIFNAVHEAITRAFELVRPGIEAYKVDAGARACLIQKGMPEITHSTGHQIGQYEHDGGTLLAPCWDRYGNAPYGLLEENMIFSLEPTVLEHRGYSVLCEEDIVITKTGARFLSTRQDALILIQ